jgi:hypothetical protein
MPRASVAHTDDPWLAAHLEEFGLVLEQFPVTQWRHFDGLLESTLQMLEFAVALVDGDAVPSEEPCEDA